MTDPAIPTPSPSDLDGGHVSVETADGIATVRFGHPKGNSLPGSVLRALADAVAGAGRDPETRVFVLRSRGGGPFCAGASFDELAAIRDADRGKEFFSGFARVILAMLRAPQPVVTRVQGRTAGGGIGIVAASDYAIAVESASCRLSELAVGIGPFVVGPVIERKIGLAAFQAMAVDADWRDAAWARDRGLYARLVGNVAELDDAVDALARRLAASNPDALAGIKRVCWAGTEGWDALLAERAAMSGRLVLSEYTREAIERFRAR